MTRYFQASCFEIEGSFCLVLATDLKADQRVREDLWGMPPLKKHHCRGRSIRLASWPGCEHYRDNLKVLSASGSSSHLPSHRNIRL